MKRDDLIIVRGGGDLATGTIHRLWAAGLRVLVLEIENPAAIRRQVALCEAVYTKITEVEGLRAVRIDRYEEAEAVWQENSVPILIDPKGVSIGALKPAVVIDAILAKRNLGTRRDMAPLTIALGPGFTAGDKARSPAGANYPRGCGNPEYGDSGRDRRIRCRAGDSRAGSGYFQKCACDR
jgi:xanthine dehydrogenase accessory factor